MRLKPFALAALVFSLPFLIALLGGSRTLAQGAGGTAAMNAGDTFENPLLRSGPDPWVISYKGTYYYMNTTGGNLTIWATPDITDLRHARKQVVWTPPASGPYSHEVWAPELHHFNSRWYLYFAADDGSNSNHRIFVLENASDDPLKGAWTMKGQVADRTNKWAIDPSAFEVNGQQYLLWSGWKGDTNGEQDIFIAHLKNPWTIDSERTLLSFPKYPWEHVGDLLNDPALPHVEVNEGPEILMHGRDIFLVYSGSACWTDYYELGVLEAHVGADLLAAGSWQKFDHPFFGRTGQRAYMGQVTMVSLSPRTASRIGLFITRTRGPGKGAAICARRGRSRLPGMPMVRQILGSLSAPMCPSRNLHDKALLGLSFDAMRAEKQVLRFAQDDNSYHERYTSSCAAYIEFLLWF